MGFRSPVTVPSVPATWVSEVELSAPLADIGVPPRDGDAFAHARFLVRLYRKPVGYVSIDVDESRSIEVTTLRDAIWSTLGDAIATAVVEAGDERPASIPESGFTPHIEPLPEDAPLISVVLCTRNRPAGAAAAVADICKLEYEPFEIILIDNASKDDATRIVMAERFGDDPRVKYFFEPRPGLSFARNRGLVEAKGSIIAFTDDDVRVDQWWLHGVLNGFRAIDNVGCVTGLVPSAALDNAVQQYFDQRTIWGAHLHRRIFDLVEHTDDSSLYPYSPGIFGTGANFAFDAAVIRNAGGFDEALGAGAPTGGGEDLDAFLKVLLSGKRIVQEPSSIIWHVHRSDIDELNKQMFAYGVGLGAFLTKYLFNPRTAKDILRRLGPGALKIRSVQAQERSKSVLPNRILALEFIGIGYGPIAYLRGLRHKRDVKRRAASGELTRSR